MAKACCRKTLNIKEGFETDPLSFASACGRMSDLKQEKSELELQLLELEEELDGAFSEHRYALLFSYLG